VDQLTVADALRLPPFRRASPLVLAGQSALGRPVRWAHSSELPDVASILRAGDLVITMGSGIPAEDPAALDQFARSLADVECAGLVLELGRRWSTEVPTELVKTFEAHGVPLVVLRHEARFAALTQAIGERVIDAQIAGLRDAQRVHETFTELSFTHAGPAEILQAVQRLTGGPLVLENEQHRPLDFLAGADDLAGFLDGWQARSTRVRISGRTGWNQENGWLLTRLGTADQSWGRLVIAAPEPPSERLIAVAERAAAALALHRLHDRDRDNLMRRTHRELMSGLQTNPDSAELLHRCELAQFPVQRRSFLALVVRPRSVSGLPDLNEIAASTVHAAHAARVPALVCEVDRDIRILLSAAPSANPDALADRIAGRLRERHEVVVAAGRVAADRAGIQRSLLEATQVADAIPAGQARAEQPNVHRLEDLHLRGLLALFGADERIRLFVDRELAPLRDHDAASQGGPQLLPALRALLDHPASKTTAAASLHLSRAAFYDRLGKIETILGVDLDEPDARVSLHVALLADELSARLPL
jgi:PucR family transcriptional regulator, purine catabolism regulatory protein